LANPYQGIRGSFMAIFSVGEGEQGRKEGRKGYSQNQQAWLKRTRWEISQIHHLEKNALALEEC
jgi:hypothetical protein